jgi:hypothetical protein
MSPSGQPLPNLDVRDESVDPTIADMRRTSWHGRKVPKLDSCAVAKLAPLFRALEFEADAIGFGASAHGASDAPSIAATKRRKPGLPRHVIDGAGW